MEQTCPKVLIISHNCFSKTSNMGKTLASYFSGWDTDSLAQLYFHSEVPNSDLCTNYFRITDMQAMKSILRRTRCGGAVDPSEISTDRSETRTDTGTLAKVYQKGRKRTPLIYLGRNLLWALSAWRSKSLDKWLDDFDPQVVFFASGDYSFSYRIALSIAKRRSIPLILCCMDDYYLHNSNKGKLLSRWQHSRFMKWVHRSAQYASTIFTISDKMNTAYSEFFQKPCSTLHTGTTVVPSSDVPIPKQGLSYLGNLGYQRHLQLVQMGQALQQLDLPEKPACIDVYSGETNPEKLKDLTAENGICFHGVVSSDVVKQIISRSLAIIYTESFDPANRQKVRFSVSTKIAESLASGTCLIAYGPDDIASMEYLKKHQAACIITDPSQLDDSLKRILSNAHLRETIIQNALALAEKNHRLDATAKTVKQTIIELCSEERNENPSSKLCLQ